MEYKKVLEHSIKDEFKKALGTISFSLKLFTLQLDVYECSGNIPVPYQTTSSSFPETHLLVSHAHIADAFIILQEIAHSQVLDHDLVETLRHHNTQYHVLEDWYQHLRSMRFNLAHIHQDYRTYASTFSEHIIGYHPQESVSEQDIYVLANNQSVRQILEVLYHTIPLHESMQHEDTQVRFDHLLLEHTPQAFIASRASWHDPRDLLMELEPRTYWWWYREGYHERGR